jgi:hypothetical protein
MTSYKFIKEAKTTNLEHSKFKSTLLEFSGHLQESAAF